MNKTASEATAFVQELLHQVSDLGGIQVGFTPPFTALPAAGAALGPASRFLLGAQNLYWEEKGAFTGEVSGLMLKDLGCHFVHGLQPVLCVGETLQDRDAGNTESVIQRQLRVALEEVKAQALQIMTIAYEPVWAIGTGRAASPDQAVPVHRMIRRTINELSGSDAGNQVRILYGGSVTPQNIARFLASEEIDGALVGGACLDPVSFATLITVALGSTPTTA